MLIHRPTLPLRRLFLVVVLALLFTSSLGTVAQERVLTKEEMQDFLLNAKIIGSRELSKGVTRPWLLTLTDGTIKHSAVFQAINERKPSISFATGGGEVNFVDSYMYNLAAYRLAELLGLDEMMPVHVERRWKGNPGSLSWFIERKYDEGERLKLKIEPPDGRRWNDQMFRMRVFNQLVYDTDRNLGNVLIDADWKLWMIDFSRAFRLHKELKSPGDLQRCDRNLLARLRELSVEVLAAETKQYLTKREIDAVMARRDLIVKHFEALMAAKGEAAVLY